MGAVGGDEVGERLDVLDVQAEVVPAGVGLKGRIAGIGEEEAAGAVQPRDAGVTTPGQVEGTQIEGQPHQVVAQRFGEEFIDLVAHLLHHAVGNRAYRSLGAGAALLEGHRIEEGIDQPHRQGDAGARIDAIHGVVEHRVAEAIDNIGKFRHNRRIHRAVVAAEDFKRWQQFAAEFLKHKMLILHLVGQACRLE